MIYDVGCIIGDLVEMRYIVSLPSGLKIGFYGFVVGDAINERLYERLWMGFDKYSELAIIMIPFSIIVKPALVLLIMLLFVARLLLVAFYQQRSGDYFSNKMFYRYTQLEIGCISRRRRIMVTANWLNRFLWLLAMVLVLLLVF